MDRRHHLLRVLEMVIGITDESNVDGASGQLRGVLGIQHGLDDLLMPLLLGLFGNVLQEHRPNVHGIYSALRPDLFGKQQGEHACAGADVRYGIASPQAQARMMS